MEFVTTRLHLRHPKAGDGAEYTAIHNSEFVLRYNAMMPTTPDQMEANFSKPEYMENALFIEEKTSGQLIGAIFMEDDDLRYGVASKSLSYFIREDFSRKGYMKEAMAAVIDFLFTEEKLECICARAFVPNTASRALLRSLGFQENGIIPRCVKGYGGIVFDDVIHTLFPENLK